jgi:hypothetical protein
MTQANDQVITVPTPHPRSMPRWIALAALLGACGAQTTLVARTNPLDVRDGGTLRPYHWQVDRAKVYSVELAEGERREVCFLSGDASVCHTIGSGERFDFVIEHQGVDYPTRIEGRTRVATAP